VSREHAIAGDNAMKLLGCVMRAKEKRTKLDRSRFVQKTLFVMSVVH